MFMKKIIIVVLAMIPLCSFSQQTQTDGNYSRSHKWTDMFTGAHADVFGGITVGYVNKYWRTDFGNHVVHENIWGEENKRIHGLQIGFSFQPLIPCGLGIHTGLFYEYYYSVSQAVKDAGYDDFTEHNLYMPLHGMLRIPITTFSSISLFGGLGFNWAMWGSYNKDYVSRGFNGEKIVDSRVEEWQHYGNGEWPRHFNTQWEAGCLLRIRMIQLGFTYSRGITNHHLYKDYNTQQNKIGIALSFVFGDD